MAVAIPLPPLLRRHLTADPLRPLVLLALVAALLPVSGPDGYVLHVLTLVFIYMTLSSGLNLLTGLTGLVDLGYIAFFAIGAYSYALLEALTGLPFPLLLLPIFGINLVCGVILGLPTLRVRGDYLAIVTLGFGELVHLLAINWDSLTSGPEGIANVAPLDLGVLSIDSPLGFYYMALAVLAVSVLFAHRLAVSRIGWAWLTIRSDEALAQSFGHRVVTLKLLAFCAAATIGGVTGALFAAFQSFVSPGSFVFFESVMILSMVVLGGGIHGNLAGVLLAAFALSILPEVFREFQDLRLPLYGLAMAAMALYREHGLIEGDWAVRSLLSVIGREKRLPPPGRIQETVPAFHLDVENVSRKFGGIDALVGFTHRFEAGRIYGIIGHNGAGKTTLVNVLTGVLEVSEGRFRFVDTSDREIIKQPIAARTFQRLNLLEHMDAATNVYAACTPMRGKALPRALLACLGFGRAVMAPAADLKRVSNALDLAGFPRAELGKPVHRLPSDCAGPSSSPARWRPTAP